MKSFVALSLAMASTAAAQRTLTVYNACPFTIWPSQPTGWSAGSFTAVTFSVPSDWDGRVWGRRNCDFTTNPGPNSCLDGGCNGGLVPMRCQQTGTGVPPATLAEFNFNGGGTDFYDVSLVDGYNLPMRVDNNVGCGIPSCPKGPFDSTGFPVGCKSACTVIPFVSAIISVVTGVVANSPNCCKPGIYGTQATCPASGVTNYHYFKDNCPNAYAYAYDEPSGTALWTCATSKNAAYTITFCP
ncbi:thaumatin-like protein [Mycena olivaceomarginata]|nr:thaumatin-like protein [Mycena olivaceomarginata]